MIKLIFLWIMNFIADTKFDSSPIVPDVSPVPFGPDVANINQAARSILKKPSSISSKKTISWQDNKNIKVLDPVNPEDADSHYEQRLESLRRDESLAPFAPKETNLSPKETFSLFSEAVHKDSLLSLFIPKGAQEELSSKDLEAISDQIRGLRKSEVLLNYFVNYFRLMCQKSPQLIMDAIDSLRMNEHTRVWTKSALASLTVATDKSDYSNIELKMKKVSEDIELQKKLFIRIFNLCKTQGLFAEFVEVLLDLLPLRSIVGIRLVFDLIAISEKINTLLPSEVQFKEIEKLHEIHHTQAGKALHSWLSNIQVYLGTITELNLSGVEIQTFPPIMVKCLVNVTHLTLSRLYLMPVVFKDLCRFPRLEHLNLSSNHLNANVLKSLFDDIKTMKRLRTIDLSNNPISTNEIAEIIEYCNENKIQLVLPQDKKKGDDEIILSANPGDPILTLNLSRLPIKTVPEDIMPRLASVISVTFRQSLASPPQTLKIMKTLLTLPNVMFFDFSDNKLSSDSIESLIEDAKRYAPDATVLRDLSIAESNFISVLERIEEEMNFPLKIPKRFKNMQDLWEQIKPSLEEQKSVFEDMQILDLSEIAIQTLPPEFIAYFSNVEALCLNESYPEKGKYGTSFNCLLALPKLEGLDLSNNCLTPSMFVNLSALVKKPEKALRSINLFGCEYKKAGFEEFSALCEENCVKVTCTKSLSGKRERESFSEDEDDDEVEIPLKRNKVDD